MENFPPSPTDVKPEGEEGKAVPYHRFQEVTVALQAEKTAKAEFEAKLQAQAREIEEMKKSRMTSEERAVLEAEEIRKKATDLEQQNWVLAREAATQKVLRRYPMAAKVVDEFGLSLEGSSEEELELRAQEIEKKAKENFKFGEPETNPLIDRGVSREPSSVNKDDFSKLSPEEMEKILPKFHP